LNMAIAMADECADKLINGTINNAAESLPPGSIFVYLGVQCVALRYIRCDNAHFHPGLYYEYVNRHGKIVEGRCRWEELHAFLQAIVIRRVGQ